MRYWALIDEAARNEKGPAVFRLPALRFSARCRDADQAFAAFFAFSTSAITSSATFFGTGS